MLLHRHNCFLIPLLAVLSSPVFSTEHSGVSGFAHASYFVLRRRTDQLKKTPSPLSRWHHVSSNVIGRAPRLANGTLDKRASRSVLAKKSSMQNENEDSTELIAVGAWIVAISSLIMINHFVGPWPRQLFDGVPYSTWLLLHYLGGVFFAGGILLTTFLEWLVVSVVSSANATSRASTSAVLSFWFDQVPLLDTAVVLPGLTVALIAGIGLSVQMYGSLGAAPRHIITGLHTLVAFAAWWGLTDLTTQRKAADAIEEEWGITSERVACAERTKESGKIPDVVQLRRISNFVSCLFVFALYAIMTLKPGI